MWRSMIRVLLLLLLLPIFTFAQKQAVLSLTTDDYPTETSWCLFADSLYGDTIASIDTGDLTLPNHNYIDTFYIQLYQI